MAVELAKILEHAQKIQALDLDGVAATSHAIRMRNVMRPDEPRPSLARDDVLACAPEVEDDRFKVPRIIEET